MGLFTKIFKVTAKSADNIFTSKAARKSAAKITTKASSAVKGFTNKGTIKTTAAIAQQGVTTATAGGRKVLTKVASNTAKGAGTTAKVAGKVIAGTAITAVPVVSGIGLLNYYKNSTALTDEDRRLKFLIEQQEKANTLSNGFIDNSTGDPAVDQDPTATGNTGVGGNSSFNPFREAYGSDDSSNGSSSLGLFAGIAAIAAGGYYLYKNKNKGKK